MKIAFVTELFFPSIGGQEVRFQELGRELVKNNVDVEIYAIRHDLSSPVHELDSGLTIRRITDCSNYKHKKFRRNPFGILKFTYDLLKRRSELNSFDVVIFNIWPVLPVIVLGLILRTKIAVDVCETRSGALWWLIYRVISRLPKINILGVSPEIIRHMKKVHGVKDASTHVIVSGVDLDSIPQRKIPRNSKKLIYFGRLTEHKNPRMLVQAYNNSNLPRLGYSLIFAGDGPELPDLVSNYGSSSIKFLGRISDADKWLLLSECALLILPSRREGFPRVVAEAACLGTPTLTVDFPDNGTRFVVQDYRLGYSVEPTIDALAKALEEFDRNPALWMDLIVDLDQRSQSEFGWVTVTKRFVDFLNRKGC